MTWEQFTALALGIVATALVRLLDRYLPGPKEGRPALAAEPMAGLPPASPSTPPPPPGYKPPEPPHGPPTAS